MKLFWAFILSSFLFQNETPYKPTEEFELKLDLQFKQRPMPEGNRVDLEKRTLPSSGMNAPYLYLQLRVLKPVFEEVRVKIVKNNNQTMLARKFDPNVVIKMDLGFTDDIKDRASAYHYIVTFLSKEKEPLSKIDIFFEEDGTYLVNGEKRGKL